MSSAPTRPLRMSPPPATTPTAGPSPADGPLSTHPSFASTQAGFDLTKNSNLTTEPLEVLTPTSVKNDSFSSVLAPPGAARKIRSVSLGDGHSPGGRTSHGSSRDGSPSRHSRSRSGTPNQAGGGSVLLTPLTPMEQAKAKAQATRASLAKLQLERPRLKDEPLAKPTLPSDFLMNSEASGNFEGEPSGTFGADFGGAGGGDASIHHSSSVPDFLGMYGSGTDSQGKTITSRSRANTGPAAPVSGGSGGGGGSGGQYRSGSPKGEPGASIGGIQEVGAGLAWGGGAGSLLPHQTHPLFNQPAQTSPFFTLQNTNSLQHTIGNLLKAVLTLSEDQKNLKALFEDLREQDKEDKEDVHKKLNKVSNKLQDDYALRCELNELKYEEQRSREKITAQINGLEETSTKDRAMLLGRVSSLEPFLANVQTDLTQLRNTTVQDSVFRTHMDQVEAMHRELEGFVTKQQSLFELQVDEIQSVEEAHHNDTVATLADHKKQLDEHNVGLRAQKEATAEVTADNVDQCQQVTLKITEVEASVKKAILTMQTSEKDHRAKLQHETQQAVEQFGTESDIRCQKLEGKQSMSESKIDVRISSLAEKTRSFEDDLGEVKSELAVVNEVVLDYDKKQNAAQKSMDQVQEGLQEEIRTLVHRHDKQLKQQNAMRGEFQQWREEMDVEVDNKLTALGSKVLRESKETLLTNIRDSEGQLLDQVFTQFREEINHSAKALKKQWEDGFASDRQHFSQKVQELSEFTTTSLTDIAQGLTKKISTIKSEVGLINFVFGLDKKKIPSSALNQWDTQQRELLSGGDHSKSYQKSADVEKLEKEQTSANRLALNRYLRSLPWCSGPGGPGAESAIRTPVETHPAGGRSREFSPSRSRTAVDYNHNPATTRGGVNLASSQSSGSGANGYAGSREEYRFISPPSSSAAEQQQQQQQAASSRSVLLDQIEAQSRSIASRTGSTSVTTAAAASSSIPPPASSSLHPQTPGGRSEKSIQLLEQLRANRSLDASAISSTTHPDDVSSATGANSDAAPQ